MNNFWENNEIQKGDIDIIQVNLGDMCNLACKHCHIEASPKGIKNMTRETAEKIVNKLNEINVREIEFTGGEPVLNPNLTYFIDKLSGTKNLTVRTNLVSLDIPEFKETMNFFKMHNVAIVGSLPSTLKKSTDSQRGAGVFEKSINILKKLNQVGYGDNMRLDLVYNPTGDYLPPDTAQLEKDYRDVLNDDYGIEFNNFISIVNMPIRRFKNYLEKEGSLSKYSDELRENYNSSTLCRIMCRSLISVDYEGNVYDCDFNLACGMKIKGYGDRKFWDIDFENFNPDINFDTHCYGCTVNKGSSCHGTLLNDDCGKSKTEDEEINFQGGCC